jgi:hypothetical protein
MDKLSYEERDKVRAIRRKHLESLQASSAAAAAEVEIQAAAAQPEAAKPLTMDELRVKYKEMSGGVASPKWSVKELNKKIDELQAEAAKEAAEDAAAREKLLADAKANEPAEGKAADEDADAKKAE